MTMDPRLQAWLDGELASEELPESLRGEAAAWGQLLEDVDRLPAAVASPGSTARVMAAIRADSASAPARGHRPGWFEWLVSPRQIRISPLAAAAALALVAWSLVRVVGGPTPVSDPPGVPAGQVYVQFVIAAPGASSVALAGDFSEWDPSIELTDADLDGVWSARVALDPGVHEYMFVIDGSEWRPDPNALSYTDDGFGQRNSVLAVSALDET
jgi:hypothetical protein